MLSKVVEKVQGVQRMRLIDVNPIGRKILKWISDPLKRAETGKKIMYDVLEELRAAKPIDAVEVVRCKDCKFGNSSVPLSEHSVWCDLMDYPKFIGGFCENGKRREEHVKDD